MVALPLSLSLSGHAPAQQPVRPLPGLGSCPLGYTGSGGYCVPSSDRSRGAIEKSGGSCPLGFTSSGNYCLSNPGSSREAIQKPVTPAPWGGSAPAATASKVADARGCLTVSLVMYPSANSPALHGSPCGLGFHREVVE